ncbi:MAG: ribosome recycling factor [Clostridiales bacterium]|nr:ribosome recycling factor [Clostridiales bacterium]
MADRLAETKDRMQKSVAVLRTELGALKAGRANPQLLERIAVDYYGSPTPISQLGNISVPEARLLMIAPWDPKTIALIEKAIQKSDLGINPSSDGKVIRLVFPQLTEERRRELVKTVKKSGEDAKVAVRNIRRDGVESIKKDKKDGLLTEDDQKKQEEKLQKQTDEFIKEIDGILASKEKEIMSV